MSNADQRVEIVADLDPDRQVYYPSHTAGHQRKVHLDDDCRFLDSAKNTFTGKAGTLDQDRDVCRECSGDTDYGTAEGTDVNATRRLLSETDPSDVGLAPMGERSNSAGGGS